MAIRPLKDLTNVYHQVPCSIVCSVRSTVALPPVFEPTNSFVCLVCQTVGRNGVLEMDFAIDRTGRVDPKHAARYFRQANQKLALHD